jgi:hypothetical protein
MVLPLLVFGAALLLIPASWWRPFVSWPIFAIAVALMALLGPLLYPDAIGTRMEFAEDYAPLFGLIWCGVALWRAKGALVVMRRIAAVGIWAMTVVPGFALVGIAVSCAHGNCL